MSPRCTCPGKDGQHYANCAYWQWMIRRVEKRPWWRRLLKKGR